MPRSCAGARRPRSVAVHAALIALGMTWYTQRPPPGVTLPAIMVDMAPVDVRRRSRRRWISRRDLTCSRPTPRRRKPPKQEAVGSRSRRPRRRKSPTSKLRPSRRRADAAESRSRPKSFPTAEAGAGKAEGGSCRSEEADRGAAGAAHHGRAPGRTPGAGAPPPSVPALQRRRSRPTISSSPRICSASSNIRPAPRRPASRASRE